MDHFPVFYDKSGIPAGVTVLFEPGSEEDAEDFRAARFILHRLDQFRAQHGLQWSSMPSVFVARDQRDPGEVLHEIDDKNSMSVPISIGFVDRHAELVREFAEELRECAKDPAYALEGFSVPSLVEYLTQIEHAYFPTRSEMN